MQESIVDETLAVVSFTEMFKTLVEKASVSATRNTRIVDIVKDVINRVPIYWAANFIVCPMIAGLDDIIYVCVSLVCLSPCSTVFWEGTQWRNGTNCLLM